MNKKITAVLLSGILLLSGGAVYAGTGDPAEKITRTETFETKEESEKYHVNFDNEITQDGNTYLLDVVDYQVVDKKELTEKETLTHEETFDNLAARDAPAAKTIDVEKDGETIRFTLKKIEYKPENQSGRTAVVTSSVSYGLQTSIPAPDNIKNVTYYDSETGTNVAAAIPLTGTAAASSWQWVQDVTIPITYKVYNAKYYEFEGKKVPFNNESPPVGGIEGDILGYLGLDERYRIDSVRWTSDVYTVDGVGSNREPVRRRLYRQLCGGCQSAGYTEIHRDGKI